MGYNRTDALANISIYIETSVLLCSCHIYHKSSCIRKYLAAIESVAFSCSVTCNFNNYFSL